MADTACKKTIVHWFRKGLRLHDNPALLKALDYVTEQHCLRPIFVLDPLILKWMRVGPNRWRFLHQSLQQLDANLRAIGSRLYVVRGSPESVFKRVLVEWNVAVLTYEYDTEPYAQKRDAEIQKLAEGLKVRVIFQVSNTIFSPEVVIRDNAGRPPLTYQKFLSIVQRMKVHPPAVAPCTIPGFVPPCDSLETRDASAYRVPSLQEFGVDETELGECLYPGGETEALTRMKKFIEMKTWIRTFEKPKTSPNSLDPSTTVLSPYIKFGCLSARLFYHELQRVMVGAPHTKPPVSLIGQMMWREFYYTASVGTANFDRMVGNPICRQIPWDTNQRYLTAWTHAKTGYPFIDAIMRQLRQEGWIHHLARHAVACFLTRGDLWLSWEEGQRVFEELLLDADWALNAGNWMWLSASAFFYQFNRVYSPVVFGKKTDPEGEYVKKYVPELARYPVKYLYEPWNAPLGVQREAGCIIGTDYPHRIVIHENIRQVNIKRMALAYKTKRENEDSPSTSNTSRKKIKK